MINTKNLRWHNNTNDIDKNIREIYPKLVEKVWSCRCIHCSKDINLRLEKLNHVSFHPAENSNDALFLIDCIAFPYWIFYRDADFYGVKIFDFDNPEKFVWRKYSPILAETICMALIAFYQEEWEDIKL